jgi:DNA repair exonuclease SbcCD nuclease subunit
VLLAHQFVTGAATCDSEEISVGGSDNVDASIFEKFDYVALGHIHGPQNVGSNRIRYCGTPLKYSLSEAVHHKSVTVVKLGAKGELALELRPLTPRHDLRQIRGTFAELTEESFRELAEAGLVLLDSGMVQTEVAVCWLDEMGVYHFGIPLVEPISLDVEALVLCSRDLMNFSSYYASTWGAIQEAAGLDPDAVWNLPYQAGVPMLFTDE